MFFIVYEICLCLHELEVFYTVFLNFHQLWKGELISWGETILQNKWIVCSFSLISFRNLKDPNSASLIRFQCILHGSEVFFSLFKNFLKLTRGDLISWEEGILQNDWIICFPFCTYILEIWRTQTLHHWSDFNAFYIIQQSFKVHWS